ncbi:MAG: GNAT family N-acetyltransferase [Planctomycetia bacterium]|nr:GNAT family N-acetyltransferase [Planctomycetia bacterium]
MTSSSRRTGAPVDVVLGPVAPGEFPVLRGLAETIWRQHYPAIISSAQIEFMLAERFCDEALRAGVEAADRWLEMLRVSGTPVGYCGYELAGMPGDDRHVPAVKLGQLYVLASYRGTGLGGLMLRHIERRARDLGGQWLWLQVNRHNGEAIGFYRRRGFDVIREAVFEIGAGFVMDDYLMAKRVADGRAGGDPRRRG